MESTTVLYLTESVVKSFGSLKLGNSVLSGISVREEKGDCPSLSISIVIAICELIRKVNDFFKTEDEIANAGEVRCFFVENCDFKVSDFEYQIYKGGFVLIIPQFTSSKFILNPQETLLELVSIFKEIEMCVNHTKEGSIPLCESLRNNFKLHSIVNEKPKFLSRYNRIPWSPPEI